MFVAEKALSELFSQYYTCADSSSKILAAGFMYIAALLLKVWFLKVIYQYRRFLDVSGYYINCSEHTASWAESHVYPRLAFR